MLPRWILPAATFLLLLIVHIPETHATIKYWNGTSGGALSTASNWSIYSGSGSTTSAPGSGDTLVFNSGAVTNASITSSYTGSSIEIRAGYTGTITLSSSVILNLNTLTIGSSSATVKMGTNSKLILQGAGTPLTGSGTLDTTTSSPNTVEYTAPVANITAATPALAYSNLTITPPGFARNRAITFNPGENSPNVAAIDTTNGYTYVALNSSPGRVVKVRNSDMAEVGLLTFNSGENSPQMPISMDIANGYAYFGTITSPGKVIKVRLSDFTEVATLTLGTGENSLTASSIDTTNGYLYVGTNTTPGIVVKIRLSDFTEVAAITLGSGENRLQGSAIDTANGYLYEGTATSPGKVVKIRLSDFTEVATITLNSGENSLYKAAALDTTNGYLYLGTLTSPGKIIKIQLSDFTEVATLTFDSGENFVNTEIFMNNGYLYGSAYSPSKIIKIRLSDFTRVSTVALNSGEIQLIVAVIDPANGYAYYGTVTSPTRLVRVSLGNTPTLNLGTAASQTLTVNGTLTFGDGTNAAPVTAATYNPILDLNGSLLLNAGSTFTASPSAIFTLAGDFTNKGTYTANNGLLTLDGSSQTLSGTTTFSRLSKTTGSALIFSATSTFTVTQALTLLGQSTSNLLSLRSTLSSIPWLLTSSNTRSIRYLNVQDSQNTFVTMTCTDCQDSGNNTNWSFMDSPSDTSSTTNSGTGGGGGGGGGGRRTTDVTPPAQTTSSAASLSSQSTTHQSSSERTSTTFTDVPALAWYFPYVQELAGLHIIEGYKDANGTPLHLFGPADPVTYAQLAKLALGTAGESIQENQGTNWSQPYIDRTHVLHYSVFTLTLDPNIPATRGAVIQTLLEALRIPLDQPSNSYSDVPSSHPFAKAIATATKLGLIQGDTNADGSQKGTFRPNAQVNRAELSKILILARQLPKQPLSALPPSEPTPPPSEVITPSTQTVTTKFAVNVRSEPAMSSPILLQLPPNTTVDRLSSIGEWIQVRLPDGRTGYLVGSYLK